MSPSNEQQHVPVIISDSDASEPMEIADAQPAVVLDYRPPTPQPGDSLKKRAVRSSMFTLVIFGLAQVLRFLSSPILGKLLVPEFFGIVALVSVFVTALAALSDVGIEQSIIRNKRGDDPVFLNTAWTLHAIRGAFLWLGTCIIAWPMAWYFHEPLLLYLMPVAGLSPLLTGFNSTAVFTLNRHLQVGKLTIVNFIYQVVGVVTTILLAMRWPSPWAIVLGGVSSNVVYLIMSHMLIPGYRNRFCWDKEVRRELMKFGKWIMVSTLITYTAMQIDRPMVEKLQGKHWLGLYAIALNLVGLPREIIGRLASVTLFPILSTAAEKGIDDLRRLMTRARGLILAVSLATTVAVVLGAPLFFTLFYRAEYHQAGWLAQLASIGAWFFLLQTSADRALLALGKTRILATSNAVNLAVTVVGALAGLEIDKYLFHNPEGIAGFMIGLALGKVAGHLMIQIEMARSGLSIFRQDIMYSTLLFVMCLAGKLSPMAFPHYQSNGVLYNGIAAIGVVGVTSIWAGLKVLRGIR